MERVLRRNIQIDLSQYKDLAKDLDSKPFLEFSGDSICDFGYETEAIIDIDLPENYPECCDYHKTIYSNIQDWFSDFPNCCDSHKALINKSWFSKEKYNHIPYKILLQFFYTTNFINKNIEKPNWYKEITDYIDYILESYGSPAVGWDRYTSVLKHWIEHSDSEYLKDQLVKRNRLLEFLELKLQTGTEEEKNKTDLNKLHSIFQRWVKSLPDLPILKEIKTNLTDKFPIDIMLYDPEFNRFTGMTKYKCKTNGQLVNFLIETTKELLTSFDSPELLKEGIISDSKKHKLDIINQQHKLNQKELLVSYTKKEIKYVNILKNWLTNEKSYFKELESVFDNNNELEKSFNTMNKEVFVTYSWDDDEHNNKVLAFTKFLRVNGYKAEMDKSLSQKETAIDFKKMMLKSLNEFNKIVVVLSKGYKEKAEAYKGGVGVEYDIITKDIDTNSRKYIFVTFNEINDNIIPLYFRGREIINLSDKKNFNKLFSKLSNEETIDFGEVSENKPIIEKEEIGDFESMVCKNN